MTALHFARHSCVPCDTVTFISAFSAQLFVPLAFTIMALVVAKTIPVGGDAPPLLLNLQKFGKTIVPYDSEGTLGAFAKSILRNYVEYFEDSPLGTKTVKVPDGNRWLNDSAILEYLIDEAKNRLGVFHREYLVALNVRENASDTVHLEVLFNNQAFHSPAIALAAAGRAILRAVTNSTYILNTVNYPLPRGINTKAEDIYTDMTTGFTVSFNLLFGMAFLASSFTLFLVRERVINARHLQTVSGAGQGAYWLATFLWDLINYLIPCLCILVTFAAFGIAAYTESGRLGIVALLFLLYGWAVLPFMYLCSRIFSIPSTGLVWLTMFNIFSGKWR